MNLRRFLFTLCFFCLVTLSWNLNILDLKHVTPCTFYKGIDQEVSTKDMHIILNKHNYLRQLIANGKVKGQPKGKNFKHLKWDKKLAIEAQLIAEKCIYDHSIVEDSRWEVGQNLHQKESNVKHNATHWNSAIQHWFDENKQYKYGNESIEGTGHYTQVIWHSTEFMGCGFTSFITTGKLKYIQLYVCNYGPGGNIEGATPYQIDYD